ncbi:MAG: S46 family peptidase [Bacteroidales bacterium]|nr:S46 family peptidase [Bacteroidales bacterium]MBQ5411269.1 S46 family peptidase [Bacteroidales bacterium]
MKRIFIAVALYLTMFLPVKADEGMWLPVLISQRIADMQAKGCRLSAEDIYSVNKASLKDAIVLFGSGCTGEVISDQGLLFTNHHCGYSFIQRHSSVEHDYLKDGFWAMGRDQELPNPGLTVSFLERMEDVTDIILEGITEEVEPAERDSLVKVRSAKLASEASAAGKGLSARVEALYYGNQYFLFVYKIYRDVRLVGAPPSSIGKFGGDTDNWMWPRHTGDFSIFRIYAGKDNEPADYSKDNVPYRPKKSLRISLAGVREGDFTFVYGCPGTTREYVMSDEVRYVSEVSDPAKIALRTQRLAIQKKYMSQDQAVRIKYSSKQANVANAWKKWQGESKGIRKMNTVAGKQEYEARFDEWSGGTGYEGLTRKMHRLYSEREPFFLAYEYYNETVRAIEILNFASAIHSRLRNKDAKDSYAGAFFKDYYQPIDEEIFTAMMEGFGEGVSKGLLPRYYTDKLQEYGSVEAWKKDLFSKSLFTDRDKVLALGPDDKDKVEADPAYEMSDAFRKWFETYIKPVVDGLNKEISLANRQYMKGQMEFDKEKVFYPDANLTLRVAYGHIEGYSPADGAWFKPVSTLKGIIEKDNPDIFDYDIPQKLRDLYAKGGLDDQPVCFLATNHTTGGNSGSPVLNADGDLIGINFDRVWEGTMSDYVFDPEVCRNVSLDVRYLLFNISRIGNASYLFKEMKFTGGSIKKYR